MSQIPPPVANRRHGWIRFFIHEFEHNPHVQFRVHVIAMLFWLVNAAFASALFYLDPHDWTRFGVFYVLLLSLYANWDTDYDAVSASGAWIEAERVKHELDDQDGA